MLFDLHCHTSEGSPDAVIPIINLIDKLKEKGYDGALITDHNSYKGINSINLEEIQNFKVLRGVEYDTKDGGHVIIVLPTGMDYELFTLRGMYLEDVIKVVHALGGIVGPAHPFDYYRLGLCNNPRWLGRIDLIKQLDFIETFNACGREHANVLSEQLAEYLNKPYFGGSDSHRRESVGLGYTKFKEVIRNENDLIRIVKAGNKSSTLANGEIFENSIINKHKIITNAGTSGCRFFTESISLLSKRKYKLILEALGLI